MTKTMYYFICDSMLGKLNRWLRVLGYDSIYSNNYSDSQLLSFMGENKNRYLLTRDKALYDKLVSERRNVILIKSNKITEQLAYLKQVLNIDLTVDPNKSRCSFCNNRLVKVEDIDKIKGNIPPKVKSKIKVYWYCTKCNKVFWKGKMWPNIEKISKQALELSKHEIKT
ncbi:MAG: Mut7-C RNAse domain-containing protein [Candidatus Odinarchaeia archaeon]